MAAKSVAAKLLVKPDTSYWTSHPDHDGLLEPEVLWIAYRKGNRADINRDTLWPIVAEYGLRPITQVAVDDEWSALRFRPLRDGEAQFTGGR